MRSPLLALAAAFAALLALAAAFAALLGSAVFRPEEPTLDRVIADFLVAEQIPGAVVAVGHAGGPPDVRAYGLADAASNRPMQRDLRFRLASLSKPITAAAVLALVRDNRLAPTDRLVTILPEAHAALDPRFPEITVGDLLRHSGGWDRTEGFDPFFLDADRARRTLNVGPADTCQPIADAMLSRMLDYDPGQRYAYSNLGYCWLQLVIERIYGTGYETAVRELVLSRVGAASMQVGEDGVAESERVHHHLGDDEERRQRPFLTLSALGAAGGWVGTAEDYFRFAAGPIDPATPARPDFADGSNYYGLGWRIWPSPGGNVLTHFGAMPGVFSFVMRDAEDRIVVALFNARPRDDERAFARLKSAFERGPTQ